MCLAIPGQVVEISPAQPMLAKVDVAGVRRNVNIALLDETGVAPGDWVLIHVGFALSKVDEEEAAAGRTVVLVATSRNLRSLPDATIAAERARHVIVVHRVCVCVCTASRLRSGRGSECWSSPRN